MKTIYFDKVMALTIDEENNKVNINWAELLFDWSKLYEKAPLTVAQAEEITGKYEKQEDGQFSKEDFNKIQEEVAEVERANKKEITLRVEDKNGLEIIQDILSK